MSHSCKKLFFHGFNAANVEHLDMTAFILFNIFLLGIDFNEVCARS